MNTLKYFRGAIVEVLEDNGTSSVIKIKGGARCRVNNGQLLDTDEKKTRLPEWLAVGARVYLDGDILTITKVGNTQYEADGIKYSSHSGAINYILHHGRAVVECDTDRQPQERPADYEQLTNITVDDLNFNNVDLFELMTAANEAGADDLAMYAHGLMCSGSTPDTDTINELADDLLWTLQNDVEENEAEADGIRKKIDEIKAEGYEVYIDNSDDTSNPATIKNAKDLLNEDLADKFDELDNLYKDWYEPALARLRAFVAAFSTIDTTAADDPAQCTIDFEAVADAAPAAELPAPPAVVYVSEPCPPSHVEDIEAAADAHFIDLADHAPADDHQPQTKQKPTEKRVRIVAGTFDGCDAILFKIVNKIYGRIKIDNGQYIGFNASGRFSFYQYDNRTEAVEAMKKYITETLNPFGGVFVSFVDRVAFPDEKPRIYTEPTDETPATPTVTDADVLATAARIKSLYDTMTAEAAPLPSDMPEPDTTPLYTAADVEAMIEAATADTYTADEVAAMVADAVAQERARHRRRPAPRLRPIFRRLWRVAAVVVPLVVLAMLTASTAADNGHQAPAADAVAMTPAAALPVAVDADTLQVVELPPVTVTAPRTPSGQKTDLTPSGQKTAAAVADASPTDEPTADTPAGQKTDADNLPDTLQPDSQPHGLTICEGTAWAYTMMNWA